jgi:hypothetical protein
MSATTAKPERRMEQQEQRRAGTRRLAEHLSAEAPDQQQCDCRTDDTRDDKYVLRRTDYQVEYARERHEERVAWRLGLMQGGIELLDEC